LKALAPKDCRLVVYLHLPTKRQRFCPSRLQADQQQVARPHHTEQAVCSSGELPSSSEGSAFEERFSADTCFHSEGARNDETMVSRRINSVIQTDVERLV
jgi:hypothetical protein